LLGFFDGVHFAEVQASQESEHTAALKGVRYRPCAKQLRKRTPCGQKKTPKKAVYSAPQHSEQ
jgi:hypothetical protein